MRAVKRFFFSSRRRHTRWPRDWSSDVCSSDLVDEVDRLLGAEDGPLIRAYFDVTPGGNFEHKNILHLAEPLERVAARLGVTPERLAAAIERGRPILHAAREER